MHSQSDPARAKILLPAFGLKLPFFHPEIRFFEPALFQPVGNFRHVRVAKDRHGDRNVDEKRNMFRPKNFAFLLREKLFSHRDSHVPELIQAQFTAHPVDDAGNRIMHRRVQPDVGVSRNQGEAEQKNEEALRESDRVNIHFNRAFPEDFV